MIVREFEFFGSMFDCTASSTTWLIRPFVPDWDTGGLVVSHHVGRHNI
jgi:hypothetical protein